MFICLYIYIYIYTHVYRSLSLSLSLSLYIYIYAHNCTLLIILHYFTTLLTHRLKAPESSADPAEFVLLIANVGLALAVVFVCYKYTKYLYYKRPGARGQGPARGAPR